MRARPVEVALLTLLLCGCGSPRHGTATPEGTNALQKYQSLAAKYDSVLSVPVFETNTNQIQQSLTNAILAGNAGLDRIGKLTRPGVNFNNTMRALDDIGFGISLEANRLSLIEQTS